MDCAENIGAPWLTRVDDAVQSFAMSTSPTTEDVVRLRMQLQASEAELELKDAELRACKPRNRHGDISPESSEYIPALQEALRSLKADTWQFQEQHVADCEKRRRLQQEQREQRSGTVVMN